MSYTEDPTLALSESFEAAQAAIAKTRELDSIDVKLGKRSPDSLHWIDRETARRSRPLFPRQYRKS